MNLRSEGPTWVRSSGQRHAIAGLLRIGPQFVSEPSRSIWREEALLDLKLNGLQHAKVRSKYPFHAFPVLKGPPFHGFGVDTFRCEPIHSCVEAPMEFCGRDTDRLICRCSRLDVAFSDLHSDKYQRSNYSDCRSALPDGPARNQKL